LPPPPRDLSAALVVACLVHFLHVLEHKRPRLLARIEAETQRTVELEDEETCAVLDGKQRALSDLSLPHFLVVFGYKVDNAFSCLCADAQEEKLCRRRPARCSKRDERDLAVDPHAEQTLLRAPCLRCSCVKQWHLSGGEHHCRRPRPCHNRWRRRRRQHLVAC